MSIMPPHAQTFRKAGHQRPRRIARAFAACVSAVSLAATAQVEFSSGEPSRSPPVAKSGSGPEARIAPGAAPLLGLAPLSPASQKALFEADPDGGGEKVGVGREVAPADSAATVGAIHWVASADGGRVGRFAVRSPGAAALRIAIALARTPSRLSLRFASESGAGVLGPYTGTEVSAALRESGAFWGPVVDGDTQLVEIRTPAGEEPSALGISVVAVSHLFTGTSRGFTPSAAAGKASGTCQEDVACVRNPSEAFLNASRSVAKIVYTVDGASYACSATLVNDAEAATQIPYLLTAKHCIDSQEAASTVNTFWFFEAAACGSKAGRDMAQLTRGTQLLYAGSVSDVALIRLREPAPAGAWFSGLDARALSAQEPALTIHHPAGDFKKFSSGIVVNPAEGTAGRLAAVAWLAGTTEPGSSGAGLFVRRDGEYRLGGTLRGGSASCTNSGMTSDPSNRDYYARLELDLPAIRPYLLASAAPLEDYSDLWYDPADPGWGVSIVQHASDALFAAWFTYDEAGGPMWLTLPGGKWTSSTRFEGTIYASRQSGGAVRSEAIGTASLAFSGASHATFSYRIGAVARSLAIQRQPF